MPSPALPSVTVIVPCYNYARYLRECVESVLSQTGVALAVIIIDDASTDDSAQIASELAAQDSRVRVIRHLANIGHIKTYNEGLQLADGTYTVLLDADDMLTAGALARACALMDSHREVGFVYGHAHVFLDDQRPQPVGGPAREVIWRGQEWFAIRCRLMENCIRSPEVVMRTSVLRRVGGFREELPHIGDLELWMRFALHGDVGYIDGPDQACYRDHAAGMHRSRFSDGLVRHQQLSAACEILFRDYGGMAENRARVESEARVALSRQALGLALQAYDREPFDGARAAEFEALAGATSSDIATARMRVSLRIRKALGPHRWRTVRPLVQLLTVLPRRRELRRRRSLQQAGLSI